MMWLKNSKNWNIFYFSCCLTVFLISVSWLNTGEQLCVYYALTGVFPFWPIRPLLRWKLGGAFWGITWGHHTFSKQFKWLLCEKEDITFTLYTCLKQLIIKAINKNIRARNHLLVRWSNTSWSMNPCNVLWRGKIGENTCAVAKFRQFFS